MNKNRPIPTEPYPRILWYQEKRLPCTDEESQFLFTRYFSSLFTVLKKDHPNASNEKIEEMAKITALKKVDAECSKSTNLKKMVVDTYVEHMEAKKMIESSNTFLMWYEE